MDFVGGYADEVRPQTFCLEGDFQEALDRIRMENGLRADPVDQLRHLSNGHCGPGLIVDHHNGHQDRVPGQCLGQGIQRNAAFAIRLQIGDGVPLGFQLLHAVANGVMLHGGGDDVLSPLA